MNFGYMHIKKTRDAVYSLAKKRYGDEPRRLYYAGGSTGGREALTAASRWPEAYDGVISNYPTANFMGLRLWGAALARAIYDDASAGWIPPALVNTIASQAVSSCDSLDGAEDGLVSNMSACRAQSANLLAELACKGEPAEDCLTDAQITRTIAVYHDGYTLPYSLAGGITDYLGYNSLEGITMQIGSQAEYIEPPPSGPNAHHVNRADQFVKYFITRDPSFNLLTLDIQHPGPWQDRIVELSGAIGATNADWSAFKERGGKVLWVQGLDDPSVSPHENTKLYNAIVEKMGQSAVDQFMRYYLIPGLAHGGGKFSITWDNLAILDDWVDKDIAPPATPVAVDAAAATKGRTRPVCVYPTWPKYKGSGDINSADNFACAAD